MLPRLGMYSPELFVHNYLNTFTLYLLSTLQKSQSERGVAFISLGEIAVAVGGSILFSITFIISLLVWCEMCVTNYYISNPIWKPLWE